jgi:hypothetical protein
MRTVQEGRSETRTGIHERRGVEEAAPGFGHDGRVMPLDLEHLEAPGPDLGLVPDAPRGLAYWSLVGA